MPFPKKTENFKNSSVFIDYIPAELRVNKDWIIVYYSKNPVTELLERQRLRVPIMANKTERLKFAKKMLAELNKRLLEGWSPFFQESGKNFKSFDDAVLEFKKYCDKQLNEGIFRADTLRTYNSNLNLLKLFILERNMKVVFALQINKSFCVQYLDWVYMDRQNSARTRNNHLIFLKMLCNYFINRGILAENPVMGIKNLKKAAKKRIIIPIDVRQTIEGEILQYKNGYHCLCGATYYCMIRNTELAKLQVKSINLKGNNIFIPKEISKNKKDEYITIPEQYKSILEKHIFNASENDFLFSAKDFLPGTKKMCVTKISRQWERLREKLKFKNEYQFYSLKDSGITDLLNAGIPAIKVRDQARHYDIKITEMYTSRNTGCDDFIKNSGTKF